MIVSAKKGNLSENGQDQSQKFAQKGFILFFKNFKEKGFFSTLAKDELHG